MLCKNQIMFSMEKIRLNTVTKIIEKANYIEISTFLIPVRKARFHGAVGFITRQRKLCRKKSHDIFFLCRHKTVLTSAFWKKGGFFFCKLCSLENTIFCP